MTELYFTVYRGCSQTAVVCPNFGMPHIPRRVGKARLRVAYPKEACELRVPGILLCPLTDTAVESSAKHFTDEESDSEGP